MNDDHTELVQLNNAGAKRDGRWLVRGVSFSVKKGEIVTLIGPNGSGKSTSTKLALGIVKPDEGEVIQTPNLRIGYVPQKLSVDWTLPLTVRRFMALTGNLQQERLARSLETTGCAHLVDGNIADLSGGELQRVMLARALALQPDFLVLDEPVQGVDFSGELAIYDIIKRVRDRQNCGILLVSHDLHFVMAATDQVICLNGHVCCQGTPQSVADNAEYRQLFGDRAASSLAIYQHDHDHTHLPDGTVRHADGSITDHCHPEDGHHHEHQETRKDLDHVG